MDGLTGSVALAFPHRPSHLSTHGQRDGNRHVTPTALYRRVIPRRFKDVLARDSEQWHRYHRFCEEGLRGRARAWLAERGYRPASASQHRVPNERDPDSSADR